MKCSNSYNEVPLCTNTGKNIKPISKSKGEVSIMIFVFLQCSSLKPLRIPSLTDLGVLAVNDSTFHLAP